MSFAIPSENKCLPFNRIREEKTRTEAGNVRLWDFTSEIAEAQRYAA